MKLHHAHNAHLAYCTNIHPAESWAETFQVLKTHTLTVRDRVVSRSELFAIGLRLSARAARELLATDTSGQQKNLHQFKHWLEQEHCYVFTINGFPYGDFHGTRVKEKVYQPDWTTTERLSYTCDLFSILTYLLPDGVDGSVSTLPGSFKEFEADENLIFSNLHDIALHIDRLSQEHGKDLHLGLEPEPLGHFENTEESIAFFRRFYAWAEDNELDTECIRRRIGINYDTCHFALEFDHCHPALDSLRNEGIRISKIHLSSALAFDPGSEAALDAIQAFDEPTYLHQVIIRDTNQKLTRFKDLPDYLATLRTTDVGLGAAIEGRIHFHIPLYAAPASPLSSTQAHAAEALAYFQQHPDFCSHFEIETYTWGVLPDNLQLPIEKQIAQEYTWVLNQTEAISGNA